MLEPTDSEFTTVTVPTAVLERAEFAYLAYRTALDAAIEQRTAARVWELVSARRAASEAYAALASRLRGPEVLTRAVNKVSTEFALNADRDEASARRAQEREATDGGERS